MQQESAALNLQLQQQYQSLYKQAREKYVIKVGVIEFDMK